ncbi:ATP-binding cassette domain-containing protein [Methylobacterium iners]|uniref:ATP-binding protein Uup n=1 Tax=Methylobacterium iners TaxID=418707 RepID=A0ABQ4RYQ5_9HYPH|nr:ATP-binding cassette domain-containing protein [Methylobacterium iners]GJD95949.1 ABC transporter ATP-binding protein uup [Methylobacterium iners]
MAAPPLLTLQDVALTFGGTPLIEEAAIAISPGERACLVGRNGSGKSTLLKIAAGLLEPDRGVRFLQPGTTIRYLAQEPDFSGFETTLGFVEAGLMGGDDHYRARYLLESLGLTGAEDPTNLSGGEGRRAALAQALAPEPDILMLDEPTNHLDLPAIEWLEAELKGSRSALVLISHDRRFLSALSRSTVWLDRGVTRRIEQGFSGFEAWRDAFLEEEERDRHKLDRKIADEEHWLRYGVTARRKRNVRRLGNLHALRKERREDRRPVGTATLNSTEADASGALVVEAKQIGKAYGDRRIVDDLSLRVMRGDRLGIVGANGAGKTTLINLLTGSLAPDTGTVRLGTNLRMTLLDQARAVLEPGMTVTDVLTGGRGDSVTVGGVSRHVIGYLKDFLFAPEQARTPVSVLSGGERNRLLIARALAQASNLLVLDEPTNDLDLETLDLLQEMLTEYAGTLILVSHDRDFLDRVVGSVLVSEGEGRWVEYAGGYSDMVAQRGEGIAARKAAQGPKAEKARPERLEASGARPIRAKLGFKDQHELKTLPERIAKLEAGIERLRAVLADPQLYARDPARFEKASGLLAQAETELAEAEDRWLALEMLREEAEG